MFAVDVQGSAVLAASTGRIDANGQIRHVERLHGGTEFVAKAFRSGGTVIAE